MKLAASRQVVVMSLIVLALCLPLLLAGAYLVNKHRWAAEKIAEIEPRHARMLGLESSRTELAQASAQATAQMARYVYPASQDVSQAGNDAQQRMRNISTAAGLSIVSSQVLPPKADNLFDRIPLTVRLEGELPALQAALIELAAQTPVINFEALSVQTIGAIRGEVPQRLTMQFNLFVLRART